MWQTLLWPPTCHWFGLSDGPHCSPKSPSSSWSTSLLPFLSLVLIPWIEDLKLFQRHFASARSIIQAAVAGGCVAIWETIWEILRQSERGRKENHQAMSERWEERTDRVESYFWDRPGKWWIVIREDVEAGQHEEKWSRMYKPVKKIWDTRKVLKEEMVLGESKRRVVVTNTNALLLVFCLQLHFKSGDNRPPCCWSGLIYDLCFTCLQCCLPCVCYYPTGFWCAQSMDPICGCVTLFKARAPSDRKVRRQWQLLTVPKHSAQNLTPRIRLNISTSNFSPTL